MGFEKLIGFLSRNLSYGCMEDLSLDNSIKKVLANHVFFDLNFIIYHCVIELEDEINNVLKIIYNLPFNYNDLLEKKIESILNKEYWKNCNLSIENILDGKSEKEIVDNFKNFLEQNTVNDYPIIFKILYWKIFLKICSMIDNFHDQKFIESINIFLDGIPSYSKILEQRRRRSKNFLEAKIRKKRFESKFNNMYNDIIEDGDIKYNYFSWLYSKFSINKSIGPTSKLTIGLERFLDDKFKTKFPSINISINHGFNHGESDNKIFKDIYNSDIENDVIIHTCDSDLVHQIISQQCYLNIKQKNIYFSVIRYYTKEIKSAQLISAKIIIKLLLKKYNEVNKIKNIEKINYLNIIDFMILLCFFGNDHLPSSLEIGCEVSLNYYFISHYNVYKNFGNIVYLNNGKLKLNVFYLSKWLEEIKNSKSLSLIVLNRFYKLPYNLIYFLVDKLKISIDNILEKFLIPFYTYEGYYNIEILKSKLEPEDLRYIYYKKYEKDNEDPPINPLDVSKLPDNYKKQYENIRLLLLKFIDFFDIENDGLQINNKIQLIDENSYQDLYKYIYRNSINESQSKYKRFYKPYPYPVVKLNEYSNYLENEYEEDYIRFLYYYVETFMNDMSDYNPCNFICFKGYHCPSLESLVIFIQKSNVSKLYKKWDKHIKDNTVKLENYFDSISHHLFITPYLKNSDYVDKINNIPKLSLILEELEKEQGCLWFLDNESKDFDYKEIDPIRFIKNWKDVIIKVNFNDENIVEYDENLLTEVST